MERIHPKSVCEVRGEKGVSVGSHDVALAASMAILHSASVVQAKLAGADRRPMTGGP